MKSEQAALDQLSTLVSACLNRGPEPKPLAQVQVLLDFTWVQKGVVRSAESNQAVQSCLSAARREQLTPFVAPAASLYLTAPGGEAPTGFTLSPENKVRLFEVAAWNPAADAGRHRARRDPADPAAARAHRCGEADGRRRERRPGQGARA